MECQLSSNKDLSTMLQNVRDQLSERSTAQERLGNKCDQLQKQVDGATEEMEATKSVSDEISIFVFFPYLYWSLFIL